MNKLHVDKEKISGPNTGKWPGTAILLLLLLLKMKRLE